MNHLAAFILRIAGQATIRHFRYPRWPDPLTARACFALLDAADNYDSRIPMPLPAWLTWNAPGGEA